MSAHSVGCTEEDDSRNFLNDFEQKENYPKYEILPSPKEIRLKEASSALHRPVLVQLAVEVKEKAVKLRFSST